MDGYRIPPIGLTGHNTGQWLYGRHGLPDSTAVTPPASAYRATALPLERPGACGPTDRGRASGIRAAVRATSRSLTPSRRWAGIRSACPRTYSRPAPAAVQALERDVLSPASSYHEMTAILDKIAAGELLGRRQDMTANQLLSHALEQLLARSKRLRDSEAAAINMQLVTWRDGDAANQAFRGGMGDALRTWRQP